LQNKEIFYEAGLFKWQTREILNGFCYTQLTDVEQETNGLLTSDHRYKFDPEEIRRINDKKK